MKINLKKKSVFIILSVLAVVLVIGYYARPKNNVFEVNAEKAKRVDLSVSATETGNIAANDEEVIYLSPTQKVEKVLVKEGQIVRKGDVLLVLDTQDLEYQLKKAQINYEMTRVNSLSSYNTASINYKNAENAYNEAKRKFDSAQELYDNELISFDEYSQYKKAFSDAENQLKLAKQNLENANVNSASTGASKQLQALKVDIDNLKKKINDSTIKANISGKVIKLDAKEGQYPAQGDTITIYDTTKYKVEVQISQYDAVNIKIGQKATVKVKGLEKIYDGAVTKIDNAAFSVASTSGTDTKVKIEVTISNPDENIKAGYEADASIIFEEKKNIIAVNFESIKEDAKGKYIFVVENNKAVKRYVKTGLESEFDVEIVEGLNEGDMYIKNPPDKLKENDMVKISGGSLK